MAERKSRKGPAGSTPAADRGPTWVRLQFTPADHRRVRVAAASRGLSMTAFARDVVLEAVERPTPGGR
ncbi:hypothetical protein [Paludisphaera mucosa]|uniref:Toxin-antitoxin system HicB family antitoxin n=1 Tax=Paludisphaera mucosa TaxID=3030827 RepID=A0ABT6F6S1_9BACT|nr:hypothetical protein [Paludisphaera mucosa]MDG3003285.1 hypothetical protein [Paludisphaera mucosa]